MIKSLIKITGYDEASREFIYENLVGELSGCDKVFKDIGASQDINGVYIPGSGWPNQNLKNKVNSRSPRVKSIREVGLEKRFTQNPDGFISNPTSRPYLIGNASASNPFPQYAYSYHGPFNANTSPWYFAPGDNYEALQDLWGMYSYSQWLGSAWKNDENKYAGWAPPFKDQPYNVNIGPELTPIGVTRGVQTQLQNGNPSQCTNGCGGGAVATPALFCNQAVRSENVSQFNFSII